MPAGLTPSRHARVHFQYTNRVQGGTSTYAQQTRPHPRAGFAYASICARPHSSFTRPRAAILRWWISVPCTLSACCCFSASHLPLPVTSVAPPRPGARAAGEECISRTRTCRHGCSSACTLLQRERTPGGAERAFLVGWFNVQVVLDDEGEPTLSVSSCFLGCVFGGTGVAAGTSCC